MESLHPMPSCRQRSMPDGSPGYEKCPYDTNVQDPELTRVTEGNILGALMRFVGGYKPKNQLWSRSRMSAMSSPGGWIEFGWAHMARSNGVDIIHDIATQLPEIAAFAWGEEAARLRDKAYVETVLRKARGTGSMPTELDWLVAGWHQISRRGDVQDVYLRRWFNDIVAPVLKWMSSKGLRHGRTLAAGTRMRNSSGSWLKHLIRRVAELGEAAGVQKALSEYEKWKDPKMEKPKRRSGRIRYVNETPAFQVARIGRVDPDQIDWAPEGPPPILEDPAGWIPTSGDSPGSALVGGVGAKANWKVIGIAALAAAGLGTAAYFLLKGKKKKKRGRRKRR